MRRSDCRGGRHVFARNRQLQLVPYFEIFTSITPCRGTEASKWSENFPRSCWRHRSRTFRFPARPRSDQAAFTVVSSSPRLNSPTAFEPSSRSLAQTSTAPVFATRPACRPSGSWLTSRTSSLVSRFSVKSSNRVMSHPINSGEQSRHHRLICVYCSLGVSRLGRTLALQPTYPTTSISGSFQCPGPAYFSWPAWPNPIRDMLDQVSVISPVVRQQLPPTSAPHSQTLPIPY